MAITGKCSHLNPFIPRFMITYTPNASSAISMAAGPLVNTAAPRKIPESIACSHDLVPKRTRYTWKNARKINRLNVGSIMPDLN